MKNIVIYLLLLCAGLGSALAETFPNKPVKIVLSVGVGSGPDVMARKIAEVLTEKWGQPVLVENRPGGGGVIGLNYINSEPPNGYTIGFLDGGTVVSYATLYKNSEPINQLEPIMPVLDANMALFASSKIQSYNDLKQEILKNPTFSSWNIGSIGHVLGAEYLTSIPIKGTHVAYKDFGQWQADVSTQQVTFAFGSTGTIKNMIQSRKNQIFAIAAPQRDPRYPTVPTIKEVTGKSINTLIAWCGFYVPVATPTSVKIQLEKDLRSAVSDRRVQETMSRFDYIPLHTMSLPDFRKKVKSDLDVYSEIISRNRIEIQ
jgi:tripartite-type tricarboxylate transporter receptor subunit TctC